MKKRATHWIRLLFLVCLAWLAMRHAAAYSLVASTNGFPDSVSLNAAVVRFIPGGKRAAMPLLLNSLQSESFVVRWNAGYAIRLLHPDWKSLTPTFTKLLAHANAGVRWNAAYLLGNIDCDAALAIPALIASMEDKHAGDPLPDGCVVNARTLYELSKLQSVRSAAAESLGKLGPKAKPAIPSLLNTLGDPNPYVRLDAAIALWNIDKSADKCVRVLIDLLNRQNEAQRDEVICARAAELLGDIGASAEEGVRALTHVLSTGRGAAREEAVIAFGKIGPLAKTAEPELLKALNEEDPLFRVMVAEAVAAVNAQSRDALWPLIDVIKGTNHLRSTRARAIRALSRFSPQPQGTIVALIEATGDADSSISSLAEEMLSWLAPEVSKNKWAALKDNLVNNDVRIRVVAAEAIWKLSGQRKQSIPILVEALATKKLLARRWAARALGDANSEYREIVLPVIHRALKDQDAQVRVFAAETLWNYDGKCDLVIPIMTEVLKDRNNPARARELACYALGRIGQPAEAAIPTLIAARANEEHWNVHVATIRALERIIPRTDNKSPAVRQDGLPRLVLP